MFLLYFFLDTVESLEKSKTTSEKERKLLSDEYDLVCSQKNELLKDMDELKTKFELMEGEMKSLKGNFVLIDVVEVFSKYVQIPR